MAKDKMLIILTSGPEDRGSRATLAFAMGTSSLISGVETTIFMTMSGAFWSRASSVETVRVQGFEPLKVYVDQFVDAGGKLVVCSPCNEFYCSIARDEGLIKGATLGGLTGIVDIALDASVVTL